MEKPKAPSFGWKLFLWVIALSMPISLVAFSLFVGKPDIAEALGEVRYILLVILGLLAGSLFGKLQEYLNGTSPRNEDTPLPANIATPDKASTTNKAKPDSFSKPHESHKDTAGQSEPSIAKWISQFFGSSTKGHFSNDIKRLTFEIQGLNNRAAFNLIIGAGISIVSVAYLFLIEKMPVKADTGVSEVLGHYIPRISIVILLQTLAYFFFRLYKSSLSQSAYYQSELTRLSINEVAVKLAIHTEDKNILFKTAHAIIQSQPSHPQPWAVPSEVKSEQETLKAIAEILGKAKG